MSVRMVTRFVYVRVGGALLEVPKRALGRAVCDFARGLLLQLGVPRCAWVVHAAAASRVGRLHRSQRFFVRP